MARNLLGFPGIKSFNLQDPLFGRARKTSKRKKFSRAEEKSVYNKYNGKCAICGRTIEFDDGEIDHIRPLAQGGSNDLSNLQWLCHRCNKLKGKNKTNSEVRRLLGLKSNKKSRRKARSKKTSEGRNPFGIPKYTLPKIGW